MLDRVRFKPEPRLKQLLADQVDETIDALLHPERALELHALRQHALTWMQRLTDFSPHLTHDVWSGSATKDTDIWLRLFPQDSKAVEIALINKRTPYEVSETKGIRGKICPVLSIHTRCPDLDSGRDLDIGLHLVIYDYDDLRGALVKGDCGDIQAVEQLLEQDNSVDDDRSI